MLCRQEYKQKGIKAFAEKQNGEAASEDKSEEEEKSDEEMSEESEEEKEEAEEEEKEEAEEEAEDEAACEEEGKSRKRKVRIDCSDASFYDLLQACRGLLGMNAG